MNLMKQAKTTFISALMALLAFGAITYTSCTTSDKCSGVVCLNGGSCSAGKCTCPSGFSGADCGSPAASSITYTNDTYTPVNIIANGTSSTIPVGGSVTYQGLYGNPLNAVASTSGMGTTSTMVVGQTITWNLSKVFPETGTVTYGIDVDSTYFFLKVQDNDPTYSGQGIYVNYAKAAQTYDDVSIPNNGTVYGIGYYKAYDSTEIYINAAGVSSFWYTYAFIPPVTFTKNQSFTFVLN
jgi:hypothetical protein